MFICETWCYLDSGFYQMYRNHGAVGMVLSFLCIYSYVSSMLWFVQNTISEKAYGGSCRYGSSFFYGNAILQGILNIIFHIPFVHMLFLTLCCFGVISMIVFCGKNTRNEAEEILFVCWYLPQKTSGDKVSVQDGAAGFEKMSMEDRMTGLKIGKHFEKIHKKIRKEKIRLENAIAFYLSR